MGSDTERHQERHHHRHGSRVGRHQHAFDTDELAAAYDRRAGRIGRPFHRWIARDVARLRLPAGALVVDVGTGPGRLPLAIADRCPDLRVEGVDPSAAMVARAVANGAVARVAGAEALPYDDASVDLVVSSAAMHHFDDVPAALAEIRRVLRPGGVGWLYDGASTVRRHGGRVRWFALVGRLVVTAG